MRSLCSVPSPRCSGATTPPAARLVRSLLAFAVLLAPLVARAESHGFTLEAGFGLGFVRTGGEFSRYDSVTSGGSVAAGIWLSERTALTGRLALHTYGFTSGDDSSAFRYWFLGPSVQHWFTRWAWVSGGAGLAVYQESSDGNPYTGSAGIGLDLRAGIAGGLSDKSRHQLGLWLEVIPAGYRYIFRTNPPPPAMWDAFVSATVNLGYQLR